MARRQKDADSQDGPDELVVDASFEDDIVAVEHAIEAYLRSGGDDQRAELLAALEALDAQIAQSEAYDTNSFIGSAFGSAPRADASGETSTNPIVRDVSPGEFQAQVALVRAAKDELRG